MSKRSLATAAAVIGLLAAAAPAHAGTFVGNPDRHAMTFSGDAYLNEMGVIARSADPRP